MIQLGRCLFLAIITLVGGCGVSVPLAGLTALTSLNLENTQVTDAGPLAGVANLREYKGPAIKRKR